MRNIMWVREGPARCDHALRARAVARLEGVRLLGIVQKPAGGEDGKLFADVVLVEDGLDLQQPPDCRGARAS